MTHQAFTSPDRPHNQWLVRWQNQTHVIDATHETNVLQALAALSKWPLHLLVITHSSFPFINISIRSSIRGGKGGFGTLLKGQSKQAGAKLTTDFGACRDLQGRRLRHVNDEIKLRKWHEIQERKKSGEQVDEDAEYSNTPSGLYNWHLMLPGWADVSHKATRKLQFQVKQRTKLLERDVTKKRSQQEEREHEHAVAVQAYVTQSQKATEALHGTDAIQQGLAKMKRKRVCITDDEDTSSQQESILTLSGDFAMEQSTTLQAKAEFSTVALILEKKPTMPLYYELKLETAGVSQLGWADLTKFLPNSDTGDGVGDDAGSFAFDGSRTRKFHNGTDEVYGLEWKSGDVIGCLYNGEAGEISYTSNGKAMGVAFVTDKNRPLVPAMSCNQGEILTLHLRRDHMNHLPNGCMPVYDLMAQPDIDVRPVALLHEAKQESTNPAVIPIDVPKPIVKDPTPVITSPEPLDLNMYDTVEQLEALGMDRLKGALISMNCKCGGSVQERARRLFSLKGLQRSDFPAKVRTKHFDNKSPMLS